jgi:hypothetical protein
VRAALEQVLEEIGVDEGESRVAIGEGPSETTTEEPPQEQQER